MHVETYIQAAETIVKRGEKPTLKAVREEAGGGSFSTICDALRLWRARQNAPGDADVSNSQPPSELASLVEGVWREARAAAEARLAIERTALVAARRDLELVHNDLIETADALGARVDELTLQLTAEQTSRQQLDAELTKVRAELSAAQALCQEKLSNWLGQAKAKT